LLPFVVAHGLTQTKNLKQGRELYRLFASFTFQDGCELVRNSANQPSPRPHFGEFNVFTILLDISFTFLHVFERLTIILARALPLVLLEVVTLWYYYFFCPLTLLQVLHTPPMEFPKALNSGSAHVNLQAHTSYHLFVTIVRAILQCLRAFGVNFITLLLLISDAKWTTSAEPTVASESEGKWGSGFRVKNHINRNLSYRDVSHLRRSKSKHWEVFLQTVCIAGRTKSPYAEVFRQS